MMGMKLDRYRDAGLLFLRIGIGILFLLHGWPKISGGPDLWGKLGGEMGKIGLGFAPAFWGFMAAFAEFGGGILLMLGFLFRPALLLMIITMLVAIMHHFTGGDPASNAYQAIEMAILFISLFFIGAGKYSLDEGLFRKSM
jgi:putative oxidoreductase